MRLAHTILYSALIASLVQVFAAPVQKSLAELESRALTPAQEEMVDDEYTRLNGRSELVTGAMLYTLMIHYQISTEDFWARWRELAQASQMFDQYIDQSNVGGTPPAGGNAPNTAKTSARPRTGDTKGSKGTAAKIKPLGRAKTSGVKAQTKSMAKGKATKMKVTPKSSGKPGVAKSVAKKVGKKATRKYLDHF